MVGRLLGLQGDALLRARRFDDAEPVLRECLAFREQRFKDGNVDAWSRHQAAQLLGGALAGRAVGLVQAEPSEAVALLAEAEPMLLNSYDSMKDDPLVPGPARNSGIDIIRESLERLVQLYEVWDVVDPEAGKGAEAARWRTLME